MTEIVQAPDTEEARARADRIRSGMRVLAEWQTDVIAAYAARDWETLGYETWDAYLDGEYGEHRVRLPREQRREIVAGMSAAGMSTRAIGAAIGVHHDTVNRDVQSSVGFPTDEPRTVLSLDGRERPATRPASAAEENFWVEPGADEVVDAEIVDEPTRPEPPKPKRRPLPEAFTEAGRDLSRAAERLDRLTQDDRFTKNRDTTHHQLPELLGALDNTTRLIQAMRLDQAQANEEARRWWATSLHKISDALTDVANSLEQEQQ
ncbi:hypothetical protein [Streptomyces sp. NPDC127038]|uniref:hypothetical protein n=1 Tax=Streptomyces sp. NPDC127038 TaxID=3347114 RepID=UPI0036537E72